MPRNSKTSGRKCGAKKTINTTNCPVCGESEFRTKIPFDPNSFVPPVWCDGNCGRWVHGACGNFSSAEEIKNTFFLCPYCRNKQEESIPLKSAAIPAVQQSSLDTLFQEDFGLPPPLHLHTTSLCNVEEHAPEFEEAPALTVPNLIGSEFDVHISNNDPAETVPFVNVIVYAPITGLSNTMVKEDIRLPHLSPTRIDSSRSKVCEDDEPMREFGESDVVMFSDPIPNVSGLRTTNGDQVESVPSETPSSTSQPGSSSTVVVLNDGNNVRTVCFEFREECEQPFSVPTSSTLLRKDSIVCSDEPMSELQKSPPCDTSGADVSKLENINSNGYHQTESVPSEAELHSDGQLARTHESGLSHTIENLELPTHPLSTDALHGTILPRCAVESDEPMAEIEVCCPFGNPSSDASTMDEDSDKSATETLKTSASSPPRSRTARYDRRYSREEVEEAMGVLSSDSSDSENSDEEDENSSAVKKLCLGIDNHTTDVAGGMVSETNVTGFDLSGLNDSVPCDVPAEGKDDEMVVYDGSCSSVPSSPTCGMTIISDSSRGKTELQADSNISADSSVSCLNAIQALPSGNVGDAKEDEEEIIFDKFVPSTSSVPVGARGFGPEDEKALVFVSSDLDEEALTYESVVARSPDLLQWYLAKCPELSSEALEDNIRNNAKHLEAIRYIRRLYASEGAISESI